MDYTILKMVASSVQCARLPVHTSTILPVSFLSTIAHLAGILLHYKLYNIGYMGLCVMSLSGLELVIARVDAVVNYGVDAV